MFKHFRVSIFVITLCLPLITIFSMAETVNPDKPLKGTWDFKPSKVWQIERAGEEVFALPFSLRVSEKDHVYIHDTRAEINYIFDQQGNFIRAFGKSGQGPGEITGQGPVFLTQDRVIITGGNGIHFFTGSGDYLRSTKEAGMKLPVHAIINEDELISAPMTGFNTPEGRGKIHYLDLRTKTDRILAEFSAFEGGVGRSGDRIFDMLVIGLSPLMTIAYHEGRIYWGMSSEYTIHISDLEGKLIDTFSVDRKKSRLSKRSKKQYFERPGLPADALDQIMSSLPNELTFFHRIEVHNGLIYVFVPELDMDVNRGKIKQIDIFSLQGKYLYRAEIKIEEGLRPLFSPLGNTAIRGEHLYAVCEKEDDSIVLVKYKIAVPSE
jgi:hypothetical protein